MQETDVPATNAFKGKHGQWTVVCVRVCVRQPALKKLLTGPCQVRNTVSTAGIFNTKQTLVVSHNIFQQSGSK